MRGLRVVRVIAYGLGALAISGCGEKDLSVPPGISYGRDTCAECRMIIDDERFACAAVSAERRYLKFDDIGCLAAYEKKQTVSWPRAWVHDLDGAGWVEKSEANLVYSRDLVTPMGYGVAAFASAEGAEKFIKEKGGRAVAWNELKMEEVK